MIQLAEIWKKKAIVVLLKVRSVKHPEKQENYEKKYDVWFPAEILSVS